MTERVIAFAIMLGVTVFLWFGLLRNPIYRLQKDKRKHLLVSAFVSIAIGFLAIPSGNSLWYFKGVFNL